MKDGLTDLAEFITEAEADNDIYDAFTYDDYVILTLAAYDNRTDQGEVNA
jgi:hypothetical protein